MRILPSVLLAVSLCAFATDFGLRFNSPGVIDLSARTQQLHGREIVASALDGDAAKKIASAPTLDQERATLPFSDYLFGCAADSKTCVPQHESRLIAASNGVVKRDNKRLSIKPTEAAPDVFVDWQEPTTKTADGDGETHWYLGVLPKSGFHQVEVQFEHDAPGSFLVNPKNGKAAFVHSGSDIASLSPDGLHLVTFNPDDTPGSLRVAAFDADGPRVELQCTARDERATVEFKGWRNAGTFDLVIVEHSARHRLVRAFPFRLTREAGAWTMATASAAAQGFSCQAE
jgi:hypothetical protein